MNFPKQLEKLKFLKQWVAYSLVWNEKKGKADKRPINPFTGEGAKANDPATWGTYDEAMNYAMRQGLIAGQSGGVGFEFAGGYAGIDLDDVVLPDGSLKKFASEIVALMDSYTEFSPSGKGLHILFKLKTPLSGFGTRRRNDDLGLEIYDSGRFFTVTGQIQGEAKAILERSESARKIYNKYLIKNDSQNRNTTLLRTSNEIFQSELTDNELLEKMFSSRQGYEIRALYSGDSSAYGGDQSRADLALCNHLAYWTNGDKWRMDNLFRQSGLMRPKWDERHGAQTYGAMTLDLALRSFTPFEKDYNLPAKGKEDRSREFELKPYNSVDSSESVINLTLTGLPVSVVEKYLSEKFRADVGRFQKYRSRKTGYANLDEKMSLYPGLYVLGAVSSLGKTTFVLQMADQLAQAGEHVLYFALEQSEFELVSKGLSRLTAQADMENAVSALKIREGNITEAVEEAVEKYKGFSQNEGIVECGFDTTIFNILNTVKGYIASTGERPVVFVDYLQIIRPMDNHQSTKDAVDSHVRAFKKLQVENDLVLVLVSSLNRQNYLTPIDFERVCQVNCVRNLFLRYERKTIHKLHVKII